MTFTTTGIGFSLLSLGLIFCGFRFLRAFQKTVGSGTNSRIGILLFVMFLSNAITVGILGTGAIFFVRNSEMLFRFLLVSHFPLTFTAILGVYTVFYMLFPSVSPWPAVGVVVMLGAAVIGLTIVTHPHPFMDASRGIDWAITQPLAVPFSYLILLHITAPLIIFTHSFWRTKSREVKIMSFIMVVTAIIGITSIITRFLLPGSITSDFFRTRISDLGFAAIGLAFIGIFLLPPIVIRWLARTKK